MKQNSISGGAFVFDCTIRFRIFHLDHFQLLLNGYRAKLLMERKLSEKDDRSASHTADFEMNFPITIFFCKKLEMPGPENWNLGGKRMLIVRLICEERSFD
jgi:hypothetical protein